MEGGGASGDAGGDSGLVATDGRTRLDHDPVDLSAHGIAQRGECVQTVACEADHAPIISKNKNLDKRKCAVLGSGQRQLKEHGHVAHRHRRRRPRRGYGREDSCGRGLRRRDHDRDRRSSSALSAPAALKGVSRGKGDPGCGHPSASRLVCRARHRPSDIDTGGGSRSCGARGGPGRRNGSSLRLRSPGDGIVAASPAAGRCRPARSCDVAAA